MAKFTDKQKAFINHYLITLNGTEAARRAGYAGNDNTLGVVAHENLRKPKIKQEIDKRMRELTMSAEEVVRRISDIACGDLLSYIDSNGNLDLQTMRDDDAGRLLKKYKKTKRTIPRKDNDPIEIEKIEIELYSADGALDKLMRYYGKYNDKIVHEWLEEAQKAGIPTDLANEIFEHDVERMLAIMTGKESDSD